jgi:hypothetical protein
MDELTRLPENAKSFMANGKRYIIHESTTVDGFQALEELRIRAATGETAAGLLAQLQEAYNKLNEGKFADASVLLYNTIDAAEKQMEKRRHSLLLQLTIFARPEGHDIREWSEEVADTWLNDFQEEGLDVADLFRSAGDYLMRFQLASMPTSLNISGSESENGDSNGA